MLLAEGTQPIIEVATTMHVATLPSDCSESHYARGSSLAQGYPAALAEPDIIMVVASSDWLCL
jgi:hypothetical protein